MIVHSPIPMSTCVKWSLHAEYPSVSEQQRPPPASSHPAFEWHSSPYYEISDTVSERNSMSIYGYNTLTTSPGNRLLKRVLKESRFQIDRESRRPESSNTKFAHAFHASTTLATRRKCAHVPQSRRFHKCGILARDVGATESEQWRVCAMSEDSIHSDDSLQSKYVEDNVHPKEELNKHMGDVKAAATEAPIETAKKFENGFLSNLFRSVRSCLAFYESA